MSDKSQKTLKEANAMRAGEYIFDQVKKGNLDSAAGKALLEEIIPDDIAIVGISCEYSNVKDTFEFY
ncbi:hypothetical protein, partial [Paenibacillus ihuae]|uniref:hypothetical protein n=1 Tax=Paenibacillus ihuae TaxID=1232431 RepID=UPI00131CFDD1